MRFKILAPGILTGKVARQRFQREALASAKLSHSHMAAIHGDGKYDGVNYIGIECGTGESLAAETAAWSVWEATSIALQDREGAGGDARAASHARVAA